MRKLILFGGDLASGKSYYSNIIGNKYDILVINKDNLKEILGDDFIAKNRKENKLLSKVSFNLECYLLKKNYDVILLESNFKDYEIEVINKIIKEYDYRVLSFVFKGDNEILHQRFLKRLNENRHYVHKSQDFTNIDDFVNTLEDLRKVKYPGIVVNIDSSDFSYQENLEYLKIIEEFIKE